METLNEKEQEILDKFRNLVPNIKIQVLSCFEIAYAVQESMKQELILTNNSV